MSKQFEKESLSTEIGFLGRSRTGSGSISGEARVLRAAAEPAGQGGAELQEGTPPSNTVPNNCNDEVFIPLRWGIDSLYVSYKGRLSSKADSKLAALKKLAQSEDPREIASAQYPFGSHVFELKDRGARQFPYVLEDGVFRIQLPSARSRSLPVVYGKVSSHALAGRAVELLEGELSEFAQEVGEEVQPAKVSRIDLYVDFTTSVDMESWNREAWLSRSGAVNAYSVGHAFSGWTIGAGGPISCRLYDKTLEIASKSHKTWLYPLWAEQGWRDNEKVWRLEFQFNTEILGQTGTREFYQVLDRLDALWVYATTSWLRLAVPSSSDDTRSRWPNHWLWDELASVEFDGSGCELCREFPSTRGPSGKWMMQQGFAVLTSHMAMQGCLDFRRGISDLADDLHDFHSQRAALDSLPFEQYVKEKVRLKMRQFNSALNTTPDQQATLDEEDLARRTAEYRRQTRG